MTQRGKITPPAGGIMVKPFLTFCFFSGCFLGLLGCFLCSCICGILDGLLGPLSFLPRLLSPWLLQATEWWQYKLLKKSLETQVWLTISLLLPTHFPCIWYHWKALLFLFTMMCHLLWLRNLGMCSTPEYGGGCKVKCAKMHCYCHMTGLSNDTKCKENELVTREKSSVKLEFPNFFLRSLFTVTFTHGYIHLQNK